MFELMLIVQAGLCLFLIFVVLLQQGKGADMGAAFGGGANTLFGAAGANSLLSRMTTGTAIAFMISSVILVNMYFSRSRIMPVQQSAPSLEGSVMQGAAENAAKNEAPVTESAPEAPAAPAAPVAEEAAK